MTDRSHLRKETRPDKNGVMRTVYVRDDSVTSQTKVDKGKAYAIPKSSDSKDSKVSASSEDAKSPKQATWRDFVKVIRTIIDAFRGKKTSQDTSSKRSSSPKAPSRVSRYWNAAKKISTFIRNLMKKSSDRSSKKPESSVKDANVPKNGESKEG